MSTQTKMIAKAILAVHVLLASSAATAQEQRRWVGNGLTGDDHGLVVARIAEPNSFAAYSKYSGQWTTFTFPKDAKVTPVAGNSVIAFAVEDVATTQLVAVDGNGQWKTKKLEKPTDPAASPVIPVIGNDVTVYRIGNTTYAFSGLTGKWDAIDGDANASIDSDTAMIVASDRIAIFSAQTGKWAESPKLADSK